MFATNLDLIVPRRRWGRSKLMIPVIPFGTQGFGNAFGMVHENEAIQLVHRAISLGVNHFDCARCYGDSLRKLRLALHGIDRSSVIVSGRVCLHSDVGDALHPDRPRKPSGWLPDFSADAIECDVEEQLQFLDIEYFDAIFLHDPPEMEPCLCRDGALAGALRLKERGLVRNVGFAMRPHSFHRQAIETGEVDVALCFNDYNLLRQSAAQRLLPLAAEHDVGVLNGFAIVRGLLTGADVDEAAIRGCWNKSEDISRAWAIRKWCQERGISLLALALQFCLREGRIHGNPIGSQTIAELEANVAAVMSPLPDSVFEEFEKAGL